MLLTFLHFHSAFVSAKKNGQPYLFSGSVHVRLVGQPEGEERIFPQVRRLTVPGALALNPWQRRHASQKFLSFEKNISKLKPTLRPISHKGQGCATPCHVVASLISQVQNLTKSQIIAGG